MDNLNVEQYTRKEAVMYDEMLKKVEKIIRNIATGFKIDGMDFEDLLSLGRITAWKVMEQYSLTLDNLENKKGLVSSSVKHAYLREVRRANAKKRIQLTKQSSLDEESEEGGGSLHDLLASPEAIPVEGIPINQKWLLKKIAKRALREKTRKSKRAVILLLVHILGIEHGNIPKAINYETFIEYGLARFLWVFFNNSPFRAINYAYPGEFLPYHMQRVVNNYWKGKVGKRRAIEAIRKVLIETMYDEDEYPRLLTWDFFEEFRLAVPLQKIFKCDRFAYLNEAFPDQYHPWEFSITPKFYFDESPHVEKAVRWLVEEKLEFDIPSLSVKEIWKYQIGRKITKEKFVEYGLREIIAIFHSPEPILRKIYPGKFMPWAFQSSGKWKGEIGKKRAAIATRWVIERYLGLSPHTVKVSCEFFREHGLWGMLTAKSLGFNSSPKAAMRNAYPAFNWE